MKLVSKYTVLKEDCVLFSGQLRGGTKAYLLKCWWDGFSQTVGQLSVEGIFLDGAVVVQMLQPLPESIFEEYFNSVVPPYGLRQLDVKGLNIVLESIKMTLSRK